MNVNHTNQITDAEVVRLVRRELARFPMETGEAIISSMRGVVHLNGKVRPLRGHEDEFMAEVAKVPRVLRQRPEIRDLVVEWELPAAYNNVGSTSKTRSH